MSSNTQSSTALLYAVCLASYVKDHDVFAILFRLQHVLASNWAILLTFEDGVQWVLRSPRQGNPIKSSEMRVAASLANKQQKIQVSQGQQYHADKDREGVDYSDDAISKTLYLLSSQRRCNFSEIPHQGR